ncbi:MAG: quinoprotein relay system zinc metallohydrolase 1 [Gammaproteobacteria bacterium]|nr:quinoprotein relay system zinc metallohydrolase 1 [Gammaproteobacteria bacterium]
MNRVVFLLLLLCPLAQAYSLKPIQITEHVYVFQGRTEHFSRDNQGNIVNTGFVVTGAGVVILDTGPSLKYGQAMLDAIATITDEPVVKIINTHHHPDHYFGNQAFDAAPTFATASNQSQMQTSGDGYADGLYYLVGSAMVGTDPAPAQFSLNSGSEKIGNVTLKYHVFTGHTFEDLVIAVVEDKLIFAGDLVFGDRAPTTPHADIELWIKSLDKLRALEFRVLIPGHGNIASNHSAMQPIDDTKAYLTWLQRHLLLSAENGTHPAQLIAEGPASPWDQLGAMPDEYERSISHLYPEMLRNTLQAPIWQER